MLSDLACDAVFLMCVFGKKVMGIIEFPGFLKEENCHAEPSLEMKGVVVLFNTKYCGYCGSLTAITVAQHNFDCQHSEFASYLNIKSFTHILNS